ncbi:MAG: class II aldolase/adducin family protein [Christensenellales bacterium]|jgi:L-fuculose-phosphate aldolase
MDKYSKIKQSIIDCVKELAGEGLFSEADSISVRVSDKVIMAFQINVNKLSADGIKVFDIAAGEGAAALHAAIYKRRGDVSAIITSHSPYAMCVGKAGVKIPAVVDDIAQIVGPNTRIACSGEAKDILRALKGRNGCVIKDGGSICIGRTPDEAATACRVLEKGAKVFVEASVLGGVKSISYLEAVLMHFVYKKKYSKADQSAKIADMATEA